MKKEKLTLKFMQSQLDEIKKNHKLANQKPVASPVPSTNTLPERKSGFGMLFIISTGLMLINKIPGVSKVVSWLSLYYGKTTFWKALTWARKGFIIFNALFGLWGIINIVGMETGSIFSSIALIGNTYIEIIFNTFNKLYNWLFNLFDNKIVPQVPKNGFTPWSGPGWFTKPVSDNGIMEVAKSYKEWQVNPFLTPTLEPTPWYKDGWTWAYIGLGIVGAVAIGVAGYFTYVYISGKLPDGSSAPLPTTGNGG